MPTLAAMPSRTTATPLTHRAIDLSVLITMVGMVSSKALLSIGLGLLTSACLVSWALSRPRPSLRPAAPFLFPMLIFGVTLLSGLNSADYATWTDFIIKKLPFVFLPLAFLAQREFFAKRHLSYLAMFVMVVAVMAAWVLGHYLMNFESVHQDISSGKAFQTPVDHTEFSIFVAFAAIVSLFLYMEPRKVIKTGSPSALVLLFIFLTLFLHILAVRSGLVVLYVSLVSLLGYRLLRNRQYKALAGLAILMVLLPILTINLVPSLKKKIGYMRWDLEQYRAGKGSNYSDSERIYSLKAGWEIFRSAPLTGVGIGDLKSACDDIYERDLGRTMVHYPHNQYLFALAGMGILGLLVYLVALLGPLIYFRGQWDSYFLCLMVVILLSAMVENTLERTYSIGFYLFFALSSYCLMSTKWAPQK